MTNNEIWSEQLEIEEKIRKVEEILKENDLSKKDELRIAFEIEYLEDLEIGCDFDLEDWNTQLQSNIDRLQKEWKKLDNQYKPSDYEN